MLQPSSLQFEDDNIETKDASVATGLQDLLGDHGNDCSYSCHDKGSFLPTAVVGNVPSDIMLDLGSPSRELLPTEDFVSGLGSLSVASAGIGIDELDFGHSFGYDSFMCMEEPVVGPSGDFRGAAAPSGCVDTDWQLSLSFEDTAVPTEQGIQSPNKADEWRHGAGLDPSSTGVDGTDPFHPSVPHGSSKPAMSSCAPPEKTPLKTCHHDSTLLLTLHAEHSGAHISQNSDTTFPATLTAPASVATTCSECPGQGEYIQVSSACELPFPELSVQDIDLPPAAEDALPDHEQVHPPCATSSCLSAKVLLDQLDSLDTRSVFEPCSDLEYEGQAKLEHCHNLQPQVDAFGQSNEYMEAPTLEEQCNGSSWLAESSSNFETGPVDSSSGTGQVDIASHSLDAQSISEQRGGSLETVQDIFWEEDQPGQPVALENVVLTADQTVSVDGQTVVCTLYNDNFDQEVILSCDRVTGMPCVLEADTFATQSTYSTFAGQLLEDVEASQGSTGCDNSVGLPHLSDIYTACETVPSQPPEVMLGGQGAASCDSGVGYSQVLDVEMDTITTTCEAITSQPPKAMLASQSGIMSILQDSRIGFPRVLDMDMLTTTSEAVISQPTDVTLAHQGGTFSRADVSGVTLSCSSFANDGFVIGQPNDVTSSNGARFTDVSSVHTTAAVEYEGRATQAATDFEFPLLVTDVAVADQHSNPEPNTSIPTEIDSEKRRSSVHDARPKPKKCWKKVDKQKAEKGSTAKCPRLFPPRLCSSDNSAQKMIASSPKDGKFVGDEINAEGGEASPKSPVTLKMPFQIQQYPENIYIYPFDSKKGSTEMPSPAQFLSDETTGRIATALALAEKCQAGSKEAAEKLSRIISARAVGKVKTGQGEFCLDGNYLRRKTVKQILQDTGFQRQECEIRLPVGKQAHLLRQGLYTHQKPSPQNPKPSVPKDKGKSARAGRKRKACENDDEMLRHHNEWKVARCTDGHKTTDPESLNRGSSEPTEAACNQNAGYPVQCGESQITGEQSVQDALQCWQQTGEQSVKGAVQCCELQSGEQCVGGDAWYGQQQSGEHTVSGGSVQNGELQTGEQSAGGGSVQDGEQQTGGGSSVQDDELQSGEKCVRRGTVQDCQQQCGEQSVGGGSVQVGEQQTGGGSSLQGGELQSGEQSVRRGSVQDGEQSVGGGSLQGGEQQTGEQITGGPVQHGEQTAEQSVSGRVPLTCVHIESSEQEGGGDTEAGICSKQKETNKENEKRNGTDRVFSGKRENTAQNEKATVTGTYRQQEEREERETCMQEKQSVTLVSQHARQHGTGEVNEECGEQMAHTLLCGEQLETDEHVEEVDKEMVAGSVLHIEKPGDGEHGERATLCIEQRDTDKQDEKTAERTVLGTALSGEQQDTFEQRACVSCDQIIEEMDASAEQLWMSDRDATQCQGPEKQKEGEDLSSTLRPDAEDQGDPDDPEVRQKHQSSSFEQLHIFPQLASKHKQHHVGKDVGKQMLKFCEQEKALSSVVSAADEFKKTRRRSERESHGQECKVGLTAGKNFSCASSHNRKKLTKPPDSISFDIGGESTSKSLHFDTEDAMVDSDSIGMNKAESGSIHVNIEEESDCNSICIDWEDERSPDTKDCSPEFKDLGVSGSIQTETNRRGDSDSIPTNTEGENSPDCVHVYAEDECDSVCIDLEDDAAPNIKHKDDSYVTQTEAKSEGDCDSIRSDAKDKEDLDCVNVDSEEEYVKEIGNGMDSGSESSPDSPAAQQSETIINTSSCKVVNCQSSIKGVCDEESTIIAELHSMDVTASPEDADCEIENPEDISSTANPELDLDSFPVVEKHGKFLDSETLHDGDIETLYQTPFILVIHQSPQSASHHTTSKTDARDVGAEGVTPVSIEELAGCLHENNLQTGAKDSDLTVLSVTQNNQAAENLLHAANSLISVPTGDGEFVDLKELLDLDCQGVQLPDSESHPVLADAESIHSLGSQLSCSASAVFAGDSTGYSTGGHPCVAEDNVIEDGPFLAASSYNMGDMTITISAAQTAAPLTVTAAVHDEQGDSIAAMTSGASLKDSACTMADYVHDTLHALVDSIEENASVTTTHFPSITPRSVPSTRLVDFVGDCTPITALEDFIGDCFSGAPADFVGDTGSTVPPELAGNTAIVSRDQAGDAVVDFSAVASEGYYASMPLPDLTDTVEVSKGLTGNGVHLRSACAECLDPDGTCKDCERNRTEKVTLTAGVTCQVHCVDEPGSISAQISPGSESKDSFVFESRSDVDRLTPALPVANTTKPEIFDVTRHLLPDVQEFSVFSVDRNDGSLLDEESHHSKEVETLESTHTELHTPEIVDSVEKPGKNSSNSSSRHHNFLDANGGECVFQELQQLTNQNFVVGTEMETELGSSIVAGAEMETGHGSDIVGTEMENEHGSDIVETEMETEHGNGIVGTEMETEHGSDIVVGTEMETEHGNGMQNTSHVSEPDPLEIWMDNRSDSANQDIYIKNKHDNENTNKFLVVAETPNLTVPEVSGMESADNNVENFFPYFSVVCLDTSPWKIDANVPTTHDMSTDILTCFTAGGVQSGTPTNAFKTGDDIHHNSSVDSNSSFDVFLQALDQHSASVSDGQATQSTAVPPTKNACETLHIYDSCPSVMPVQERCPTVVAGIQRSCLTSTNAHYSCTAVTDVQRSSPVAGAMSASLEVFCGHAFSSSDKTHFRTEATETVAQVQNSQISLSTTTETVYTCTSFESTKLEVTRPSKALDMQASHQSQLTLSSHAPTILTLNDLASLLPGNMSKSDTASVSHANGRAPRSLTSLTDVSDCAGSMEFAPVTRDHGFSVEGNVVAKDKSLDNIQNHIPIQSSPFCTPALFSYTTIPVSLAASYAPLSFGRFQLPSMALSSTTTTPMAAAFAAPRGKLPVNSTSCHLNSEFSSRQGNDYSSLQPLGSAHETWSEISESDSVPVSLSMSSSFQGQTPSTVNIVSPTSASALPVSTAVPSEAPLPFFSGSSGVSVPSATSVVSADDVSGMSITKPVSSGLPQGNLSLSGPALLAGVVCSLKNLSCPATMLPETSSSLSGETATSLPAVPLKQPSATRTHSDTSPVDVAQSCLDSTPCISDPPVLETSAASSVRQLPDTPMTVLPQPAVTTSERTSTSVATAITVSPDSYSIALELMSLTSRRTQFSHPSPFPTGTGSRNMSAESVRTSLPACITTTTSATSGSGMIVSSEAFSSPVRVSACSHAQSAAACSVDSLCSLATTSLSSSLAVPVCSRTAKSSAHSLPLTLSSVSPSALWTSSMKFVVTPVPSNRFHPSCPCHPLSLDTGGETLGPPCIPFSPAMLNCQTMKARPPVMACPDDLPQNPCLISEGVYEYSPSASDIHMAQVKNRNSCQDSASSSKFSSKLYKSYKINTICIGDFTFTVTNEKYSKDSNVGFSYYKRKVCYNMVLTQPMSDEEFDGRQQVISTEINFSSIVGLWGHEDKLLLELSTAPDMFLVSGTARLHSSVKRRKAIDITGGQIRRVPYHFLIFQKKDTRHLKHNLCEDPFFCNLLIHPVTVDLHKTYPFINKTPGFPDQSDQMCKCKGVHGCRRGRCVCLRSSRLCTGRCTCHNCQNPFNQFHGLRLSLSEVCADRCLMDRLGQVKDIGSFLDTPVELKCCGAKAKFFNCVPNCQQCPKCSALLGLSWCLAKVFIESLEPRNHCDKCKRCVKSFHRHCEACGRCRQFSKGQCLKCMHEALCQDVLSGQV